MPRSGSARRIGGVGVFEPPYKMFGIADPTMIHFTRDSAFGSNHESEGGYEVTRNPASASTTAIDLSSSARVAAGGNDLQTCARNSGHVQSGQRNRVGNLVLPAHD